MYRPIRLHKETAWKPLPDGVGTVSTHGTSAKSLIVGGIKCSPSLAQQGSETGR